METLPRLSYGNIAAYVIYLNCERVYNKKLVDDKWIIALMQGMWQFYDQLGVIYLTTEWPGIPRAYARKGLRPGEYFEIEFVEDGTLFGSGGKTLLNQHNNLSLYNICKAYVLTYSSSALQTAINAVHESGHGLLPRKSPWGDLAKHTKDPRNLMYERNLYLPLSWSNEQIIGWGWGLYNLRTLGLRYNDKGDEVKVSDGGHPAWPLVN